MYTHRERERCRYTQRDVLTHTQESLPKQKQLLGWIAIGYREPEWRANKSWCSNNTHQLGRE